MSPETDNPDLDVKASCLEQVIQELESHFAEWRDKTVRRIYQLSVENNSIHSKPDPIQEEDVVKNGGKPDHEAYDSTSYPSPDFFNRMILPTLLSMTDDPDELLDEGIDVVEIFEKLLVNDLSHTKCVTRRSLVESFFQNVNTTRTGINALFGHGGRVAKGQFKYFYGFGKNHDKKRFSRFTEEQKKQLHEARKWLAAAVVLYQGHRCDPYYDGCDKTESIDKLMEKFLPVYRSVPLEFRGKAMEGFVKTGGGFHGVNYLKVVPGIVEKLKATGGRKSLSYFFELVEYVREMRLTKDESSLEWNQFPVDRPDEFAEELLALQKMGEFENQGFALLKWLYSNNKSLGLSFLDKEDEKEDGGRVKYRMERASFPKVLAGLRENGYSDPQIHESFDVLINTPALRHCGRVFLNHYADIDRNFPGGFAALMPYLEMMERAPECAVNLLERCAQNRLPQANLTKYLELGVRLANEIYDCAAIYFSPHIGVPHPILRQIADRVNGGNGVHYSPQIAGLAYSELAETDWDKFEAMTIEARNNAEKFMYEDNHCGSDVFKQTLWYCLDPHYKEWKAGLFLLHDGVSKAIEGHGDDVSYHTASSIWNAAAAHYNDHIFEEGKSDSRHEYLPEDARYDDYARIIARHAKREIYYGSYYGIYCNLRKNGLDYRVACHLHPVMMFGSYEKWEFDHVEGVECLVPKEKMEEAVGLMSRLLEQARSAKKDEIVTNESSALTTTSTKVAEFRNTERSLAALAVNPHLNTLFEVYKTSETIEDSIKMLYLKGLIYGPLGRKTDIGVPESPFLSQANQHTRMAAAGISLLSAAGVIQLPGMPQSQVFLPISKLSDGRFGREELERLHDAADLLSPEVAMRLPVVEKLILAERDRMPGIMPIGGKIHTQKPMDQKLLDFIMSVFGLSNTPFKLIHSDTSLLIPPMASALEFNMIVKILELFGVIDPEMPDIQLAVAGRWNENLAPYVGSAVLLGTDRGVLYGPGAFSTNQNDKTGARIMAYDAGIKISGMPFDVQSAKGRTDMLGRHSLGDTFLYQLLGTMASHHQFGGEFSDMMPEMQFGMDSVLRQYGLDSHLRDSAWVYDYAVGGSADSFEQHEQMVGRFAGVRMAPETRAVQQDIRQLIADAQKQMMGRREEIIAKNPHEYSRLMKY